METKGQGVNRLPMYKNECNFEGYDAANLMKETAKIRKLITKRGTIEMLIPLCCSTKPVRYKEFRQLTKGISKQNARSQIKRISHINQCLSSLASSLSDTCKNVGLLIFSRFLLKRTSVLLATAS